MKHWPLRYKITGWAALTTGLALLTFGLGAAWNLYSEQIEAVDKQMTAEAGLFFAHRAELVKPEDKSPDWLVALSDPSASLFGFAIGRTGPGAELRFYPEDLEPFTTSWPPSIKFSTEKLGRRHLRIGVFVDGADTLLLAAKIGSVREIVRDLLGTYLLLLPVVLLVVAGGSWWMAGQALRPIDKITQAAASITADRLGERLPAPATLDEIGQHVVVLNHMFDRLQRSFEQATRFTADAAHELRTPLTIMRGQLEEALHASHGDAEQERLLVGLLEETSGLQKISDNLLLLARFDAGKASLDFSPIDLSALVQEACEDAELLAAAQRIKIKADIVPALRVKGDAVMLRRVALNLVDNAVKFNRADGRLELALHAAGDQAVFTIANTGTGIPPERQGSLFERFFRVGADRNRDAGGSGLGLNLCREIVTAHGGSITLSRSTEDWTEFRICLPALAS
ncbi:MAG TPA: HAMP domain-containing sensor histidine kinase [Opitutaceae bacterium]|nr:HAMP domain-containing sensor histidine kinase [Opitutaceae bacterium]